MAGISAGLWVLSTLSLHESWKHGMSFFCWKSVDSALFDSVINPSYPLSALSSNIRLWVEGFAYGTFHQVESVVRVLSPASSRDCKVLLILSLTLSNHTNGALANS